MSDIPDPLEAELSALRPCELSAGLRQRVAERQAEVPAVRMRWWRLALAGGLAAACLAAILFWWNGGREPEPIPSPRTMELAHEVRSRPPDEPASIARWLEGRRAVEEMPTFTWPLEETSPISVSNAIPADLLD